MSMVVAGCRTRREGREFDSRIQEINWNVRVWSGAPWCCDNKILLSGRLTGRANAIVRRAPDVVRQTEGIRDHTSELAWHRGPEDANESLQLSVALPNRDGKQAPQL